MWGTQQRIKRGCWVHNRIGLSEGQLEGMWGTQQRIKMGRGVHTEGGIGKEKGL